MKNELKRIFSVTERARHCELVKPIDEIWIDL